MPSTLAPPPVRPKKRRRGTAAVKVQPLPKPATTEATPAKSAGDREVLAQAFDKSQFRWNNVDWTVAIFMGAVHVGALAAPFFFSWAALGVCLVLHWLTASIGICLGYHRYLAHRSLKLAKPVEFAAMALGTISGEGTPLVWSATHRMHHQKSDQEGDPHSPLEGTFWSHLWWLFVGRSKHVEQILLKRYVPELLDRPMMRFFEKTQALWLFGTGAMLTAAGWFFGGPFGAVSFLLWGFCMRLVLAYHSTWFVNSATHLWGYRNYKTRDESRNLWWVAILAYGEGWHNNHHAHPTVAPAGHRWWEIDITWWAIKALRFCGLAWDVNDRIPDKGAAAADHE